MYWCCWTGCNAGAQSNEVKQFNTNTHSWRGTDWGRHLIWNTYSVCERLNDPPFWKQVPRTAPGSAHWTAGMGVCHVETPQLYRCVKKKKQRSGCDMILMILMMKPKPKSIDFYKALTLSQHDFQKYICFILLYELKWL